MIRLQIKPEFASLLEAHELGSFAQLMQVSTGTVIEEDETRDVRCLDLDGQKFYLKRTWSEKLNSALESYARARLAHSKPFKEMMHYRQLEKVGIEVAQVVAAGEELRFGIPQRGMILTREVGGQDLAEFYRTASVSERRRILQQFGLLMGRLHHNGFYGSTRLKDIIVSDPQSELPGLTLIDRETRNPYPKPVNAKTVISRLLFNIRRQAQQGEIFSEPEWRLFCEAYCRALPDKLAIDADTLYTGIIEMLEQMGKPPSPEEG